MKLNNTTNLLLAKKAVYAEQLFYYSKLCQAYQDLAEYAQRYSAMTPKDLESKYAEPLSKIISSDNVQSTLHELGEARNFDLDNINIGKKYSKAEMEHFKKFARAANVFRTFQEASELLDDIQHSRPEDKEDAIEAFHSYMSNEKNPKTVRSFDKLIQTHSPRYLGARFFLIANESIKRISEIDDSHIPVDKVMISKNMTPEKFGAIINGYKTIQNSIEDIERFQGHEDTSSFQPNNWNLYNISGKKVNQAEHTLQSQEHSFKEKAYVAGSNLGIAGNKVKKVVAPVYKAHKGTLKKAVLIAAAVASIFAGVKQVGKEIEAHNLDISSSTQYEQTVTSETEAYINNILEELNLQKSAFDPQYEDVKAIEQNIDLVLDYIVKDQVTTAFEQYHKGYQVTDVESWFDKSLSGTANNPHDYQFIDVSYIDDKGNEGKESISDFRSDFLLQNHLKSIFELEEKIDLNSPVAKAFLNDGTKNYSARFEDLDGVMEYLTDAVEITKHVASFSVEHGHTAITGTPYLKSTLPEKNDDEER